MDKGKAPPTMHGQLTQILSAFRAQQQEMQDFLAFPIPFEYIHLLSLMITVNLIVWAYGMAQTESIFGPLFFFFAALIFMGMMDLASQLADPFGEDDADFPLPAWLTVFLHDMAALLDYSYEGAADGFKRDVDAESKSRTRLRFDLRHVEYMLGSSDHSGNHNP